MKNVSELLKQYKNPFTLDDQLRALPGVTEARVKRAQELIQKARRSRAAEGQLVELFTTSNLSLSVAHLLNIQTIPQLPEELKAIDGLAGQRTVRDFNPVVLRSLIASAGVEGAGINADGSAAIVPEGTPFPKVTVKSDEESFYSKLSKRGFRFDFTFESIINDILNELDGLPAEMLKVTIDTIYAEIFDALDQADQHLPAVTLPDGTTTPADAPVSALAIIAAVVALENREINGRKIGTVNEVNVLVPKGRKRFLDWDIAQFGRVLTVQEGPDGDGAKILAPDTIIQSMFPNVTIIESDRLTGTQWKLYPKPGTTPRPVLERLNLRGYENPEIRVRSDQGFYVGGGKVDLYDGGFDADTASYRYRHITGAVLWDDTWVVVSDGDGA